MNNTESEDPPASSKFHTLVQPHRDLESNWTVDLAKSLEDYLLKICSGEITGDYDAAHFSVNFAEAALLLQGSVQVYSRKVEYLYNLVLHTLEFISQTRSQDHAESSSVQAEAGPSRAVNDEDDQFWVSDEIPVETKNCLDSAANKDSSLNHFLKPPSNLVVLEGECLDSTGDGGELESYLLATNNLYRDFILLDPCDAVAVDEFLKADKCGQGQYRGYGGSSLISKAHKSFLSPGVRHSGGTARKSSAKKGQNIGQGSPPAGDSENHYAEAGPSNFGSPHENYGFESYGHHSEQGGWDDSDDDDANPWKPLNPHEPGHLKVKPFKKVKVPRRIGVTKQKKIASPFPLAKLHGTTIPELTKIWEMGLHLHERQGESQSPGPFEKLRESLANGGNTSPDTSFSPEDGDAVNLFDDGIGFDDSDQPEFGIPDSTYMDDGVNIEPNQHDDYVDHRDIGDTDVNDDPNSQASLEDLCRAHLDSLLAKITESEKQTELAARVSTWKQRIEHDLEEEDLRPPFDIHEYGERILYRLSLDEGENIMSFTDVVKGQEKHDVARSFSALLQMVNDRKVDLDRGTLGGDSFCFTAENPFHVSLLGSDKEPKKMHFQPTKKRQKSPIKSAVKKMQFQPTKKRQKSPSKRQSPVVNSPSSEPKSTHVLTQPTCKFSVKLAKTGGLRSPDGKRRRKSGLVE